MNIDDFSGNSDSSDEDYIPNAKPEEVSEVESDGDSEEPLSGTEENTNSKGRKRTRKLKRIGKKGRKKNKVEEPINENSESNNGPEQESEDDKKKKADDLWADFMKDTGFTSKTTKTEPSTAHSSSKKSNSASESSKSCGNTERLVKPQKVKITEIFEFAGEEVKVEKEVDSSSAQARLLASEAPQTSKPKKIGGLSGIGSVLSQLGKKQKISTLEKSKLDWDRFKKEENIEEELQTFNKGKDGYLERQDFLQRADLRRFEIEKNIRNVERAKRINSTL